MRDLTVYWMKLRGHGIVETRPLPDSTARFKKALILEQCGYDIETDQVVIGTFRWDSSQRISDVMILSVVDPSIRKAATLFGLATRRIGDK